MKNLLIKTTIIFFISILVIFSFSNISMSVTLTTSDLKTALEYMYNKEITILVTDSTNETNELEKVIIPKPNSVTVEDNGATIVYGENEYKVQIDITESEITFNVTGSDDVYCKYILRATYLAVSKALNMDLPLVYNYLYSNTEALTKRTNTEMLEFESEAKSMKINLDNFSTLTSSDLTSSLKVQISFYESNSSAVVNSSTSENPKDTEDTTISTEEKVPAAGIQFTVKEGLIIIAIVAAIGIIFMTFKNKNSK